MTCSEINNLLSAYLEDALSPEEKKFIGSHLTSCALCQQSLADLKRAGDLVKDLEEVEPPPFFERRIMARIREEAGREKGILRKLFYPLYIKIPIQAMATVLIAVLAFYVYQKNEPAVKQQIPFLIPLTETGRGQNKAETPKAPIVPSVVTPATRAPSENLPDKDQHRFAAAPPFENIGKTDKLDNSPTPKQEERPATEKPGTPIMAAREKEIPPTRVETLSKSQDRAEKQEAVKAFEALPLEQKRKGRMADTGIMAEDSRTMKSAPAASRLLAAPAQKRSAVDLTIQVRDATVAVREIEEYLGQVDARISERGYHEGRGFLTAEIAVERVTQFLNRLKAVGKIDLDKNALDLPEGMVTVRIQIVTNP